jgi:hypothetical protein
MELCRLYDGDQRVISNVGGRPWASFGVLVRDRSAKEVVTSQRPRSFASSIPPITLLSSPRGRVAAAQPYPTRPYAGPFESLIAHGLTESQEVVIGTTHKFTPLHVETRWNIVRRLRARYTVDVLFPSWGKTARVEAVMRGGGRVILAQAGAKRRQVSLRDVAYFYIAGEETGYVVVPIGRRPRATVHILKPGAQSSSPRPGPTLAVQLARGRRFRRLSLSVRIAPAATKEEATRIARSLRRTRRRKRA